MTSNTCTTPSCDRSRPEHQWICLRCEKHLEQDLASVPALWKELDITLTRLDVVGGDDGRRSVEMALMFKPRAAEARWVLANTVGTWARLLAEHNGLEAPLRPARWLLLNVHSLAMHEAAGEAVDEIRAAVANAYRTIDRPPELLLAGVCNGQFLLANGDVEQCEVMLYARPGDVEVACQECDTIHRVDERREWMMAAAAGLNVTALVALGWVRLLMDKTIPRGTWDCWVSRGRILSHGMNAEGQATYNFGEVQDLAAAWVARMAVA